MITDVFIRLIKIRVNTTSINRKRTVVRLYYSRFTRRLIDGVFILGMLDSWKARAVVATFLLRRFIPSS